MEIRDLNELPEVAQWILDNASSKCIAFYGEMGVGKTTLIKAICKQMGVEDKVSSPTFSLVNEYYSAKYGAVYHFDFYRMEKEEEALDMGLEDYLYANCFCLMEWPEKIRNFLPEESATIHISLNDGKRTFEVNKGKYE